jgi:hypothetical protein
MSLEWAMVAGSARWRGREDEMSAVVHFARRRFAFPAENAGFHNSIPERSGEQSLNRRCTMLTDSQLYVLAFIAPIIIYVINALLKSKITIGRGWLTAAVYVVSGLLAYAWSAPIFPAFPLWGGVLGEFMPALFAWMTALLIALGPIVALATLIYNVLLKKVLDGVAAKYFAGK